MLMFVNVLQILFFFFFPFLLPFLFFGYIFLHFQIYKPSILPIMKTKTCNTISDQLTLPWLSQTVVSWQLFFFCAHHRFFCLFSSRTRQLRKNLLVGGHPYCDSSTNSSKCPMIRSHWIWPWFFSYCKASKSCLLTAIKLHRHIFLSDQDGLKKKKKKRKKQIRKHVMAKIAWYTQPTSGQKSIAAVASVGSWNDSFLPLPSRKLRAIIVFCWQPAVRSPGFFFFFFSNSQPCSFYQQSPEHEPSLNTRTEESCENDNKCAWLRISSAEFKFFWKMLPSISREPLAYSTFSLN